MKQDGTNKNNWGTEDQAALSENATLQGVCGEKQNRIKGQRRVVKSIITMSVIVVVLLVLATLPATGKSNSRGVISQWAATIFWSKEHNEVPVEDGAKEPPSSGGFSVGMTVEKTGYSDIYDAAEDYGIGTAFFPKTLPEGYVVKELYVTESPSGTLRMHTLYYWGEKTLTLDITRYARQGSTGIYEKNDEPVEEFLTTNGFHYYVFSNTKNVTAACAFDNVEVSIGMNGSREDLKALLETIG